VLLSLDLRAIRPRLLQDRFDHGHIRRRHTTLAEQMADFAPTMFERSQVTSDQVVPVCQVAAPHEYCRHVL